MDAAGYAYDGFILDLETAGAEDGGGLSEPYFKDPIWIQEGVENIHIYAPEAFGLTDESYDDEILQKQCEKTTACIGADAIQELSASFLEK